MCRATSLLLNLVNVLLTLSHTCKGLHILFKSSKLQFNNIFNPSYKLNCQLISVNLPACELHRRNVVKMHLQRQLHRSSSSTSKGLYLHACCLQLELTNFPVNDGFSFELVLIKESELLDWFSANLGLVSSRFLCGPLGRL